MDDPFAILGLDRRFDLTAAEVNAAHLRTVARLHPDRAKDPLERDRLVRASATAGAAKQRLLDEHSRAEELLEFLGARSFLAAPLSPAFLMETMELREEVEAVCARHDPADRASVERRVHAMSAAERQTMASALAEALCQAAQGSPDEAASRAAAALVRLRYLTRMAERLRSDP